jgi:hypothetical protein
MFVILLALLVQRSAARAIPGSFSLHELATPAFLAKAYQPKLAAALTLKQGPSGLFLLAGSHSQLTRFTKNPQSTCEFMASILPVFRELTLGQRVEVVLEGDEFMYFYIVDCEFRKEWGTRVDTLLEVPIGSYHSGESAGPAFWAGAWLLTLALACLALPGPLSEGQLIHLNPRIYLFALFLRVCNYWVAESWG